MTFIIIDRDDHDHHHDMTARSRHHVCLAVSIHLPSTQPDSLLARAAAAVALPLSD